MPGPCSLPSPTRSVRTCGNRPASTLRESALISAQTTSPRVAADIFMASSIRLIFAYLLYELSTLHRMSNKRIAAHTYAACLFHIPRRAPPPSGTISIHPPPPVCCRFAVLFASRLTLPRCHPHHLHLAPCPSRLKLPSWDTHRRAPQLRHAHREHACLPVTRTGLHTLPYPA